MSGQTRVTLHDAMSTDTVFAPVRSQTAFDETVDRLGTAIKLGLLAPGERLPAERELCQRLGIARSTLRQALTALAQSGHLIALRGRGGGTFVAQTLPPLQAPSDDVAGTWRETCDARLAVELGVVVLAAERASALDLDRLQQLVVAMSRCVDDYSQFRRIDVRFHIGLAQSTRSARLVTAITDLQGQMGDLISHIAHPATVLAHSNRQHLRLLAAIRAPDPARAVRVATDHLKGTEHMLAGLLPGSSEDARPRPV